MKTSYFNQKLNHDRQILNLDPAAYNQGMLWNGRQISVRKMELLKYGMKDSINGMERIFHTSIHFPYLLILMLFSY